MEDGLVGYLNGDAGLATLVAGRIYPEKGPQGTVFPRVLYAVTDTKYDVHLRGPSHLGSMTLDLICQAQRKSEAKTIAQRLEVLLSGHQGDTWGAWRIDGVFLNSQVSDAELYQQDGDQWVYSSTLSVTALYAVA